MRILTSLRLMLAATGVLILASVFSALAAGLSMPASNVDRQARNVSANDVKPAACSGLYLSAIVTGTGTVTGTTGNDLIIGSSGADLIDGLGGNDCILGGGGDDSLAGSDGSDVCLGGPGNDLFTDCESEVQ